MICWMSDDVSNILTAYGISVIGFDIKRESADAWCAVELGGTSMMIRLGDVEGLTHHGIELRFAAAMLQLAIRAAEDGDRDGYCALDQILEALSRKE